MIVLEIPAAPHGLNTLIRMNWPRRHAETKRWRKLIWVARCQVIQGRPTPIEKAKVTLVRSSPRLLDEDNLYGSAKMVLDALKCNELIVDDGPEHLSLVVRQQKGKSSLRVELESSTAMSASCTSKPVSIPT